MLRRARAAAVAAAEEPARASVPAVAAPAECPAAEAPARAASVPAEGQAESVKQLACGKAAVVGQVPEAV